MHWRRASARLEESRSLLIALAAEKSLMSKNARTVQVVPATKQELWHLLMDSIDVLINKIQDQKKCFTDLMSAVYTHFLR